MLTEKLYSLEEVALKYDVKSATLKTWCKNELVPHETMQNGRKIDFHIPESSFPILSQIIELKKITPRISNEEIKNLLKEETREFTPVSLDTLEEETTAILIKESLEEEISPSFVDSMPEEKVETVFSSALSGEETTPIFSDSMPEEKMSNEKSETDKLILFLSEKLKNIPTRDDVLQMIIDNEVTRFPYPDEQKEMNELKRRMFELEHGNNPSLEILEDLIRKNKELSFEIQELKKNVYKKEKETRNIWLEIKSWLKKILKKTS